MSRPLVERGRNAGARPSSLTDRTRATVPGSKAQAFGGLFVGRSAELDRGGTF